MFQIKPLIRDNLSIGEELCTNAMRQNKYTASQNWRFGDHIKILWGNDFCREHIEYLNFESEPLNCQVEPVFMSFLPDIKWHPESLGTKPKGTPSALNKWSPETEKGGQKKAFI